MSDSKSLKADKELMWKKLSTPHKSIDLELEAWVKLASFSKGHITVFAATSVTGKSMYIDIETNG